MKQNKSIPGRLCRRLQAPTPFLVTRAEEQTNSRISNRTDKTKFLSQSVGSNHLSFEFISLSDGATVGVTRSIRTHESGVVEQALVFTSAVDFQKWLDADEFQGKAPELFFSVRQAFQLMLIPR